MVKIIAVTLVSIFFVSCGGGGESAAPAASTSSSGGSNNTVKPEVCLENYSSTVCTLLKANNSTVVAHPVGSCTTLIPNPTVVIDAANNPPAPSDPVWLKYPQIQNNAPGANTVSCYFIAGVI